MRLALLAIVAAGAAFGQLQLYSFDGVHETPLPGLYDAGSVAIGDSIEIRIRVRNLGPATVSVQTITASGVGFTVTARPLLPYALVPGAATDFRIGFTPAGAGTYSGVIGVNGVNAILRASAVVAAELSQNLSGARVVVPGGATIDLGRVQRGQSFVQQMFLRNPGTAPLKVTRVAASGEGFDVNLPGSVTLAAGESLAFVITFAPVRTADFSGTLAVDQRTFGLRGIGFDPPLPAPSGVIDSNNIRCGEQHSISLRFASPAPVNGAGTLQIFFTSAIASAALDPAVQFVKTGSRSASFTVSTGDTQARFGTDVGVLFQTGTTAGALRFQITVGGAPATNELTVALSPARIEIDTVSASRRIDGLDLKLTGFDNTYSAGQATFTFFDAAGKTIAPGAIKADFTSDFKSYFAGSTLGSAFQMGVFFPVAGDASQVAGVEAELTNAVGTTKTKRIAFP